MKAHAMVARDASEGLVLCHNVYDPAEPKRILLRKGHVISTADQTVLARLGGSPLHLLELEADDVSETEAGAVLGAAVAGSGVAVAGESESQVRLAAAVRGVLHVDAEQLATVHSHDGVLVWTLDDGMPVEPGRHIASAKVAPLAVRRELLQQAARAGAGGITVAPYIDRCVVVLVRERMTQAAQEKFETSIRNKVAWFGARPPVVRYIATGVAEAEEGLRALVEDGAELVLVGGTGSTDPLDPLFTALDTLGGRVLRFGVPAHPGSTYWLGALGEVSILGLASCGMFSQVTALDLLLPRFFSGEPVTPQMLTSLAIGGLIGRDRAHLFPQYEKETGQAE
ncbi:MAG: hypothetical protein M3506_04755 [Chloroflexota bacterium]|nr:hypothetical protein [Chloroflexota bacterium]